MFHRLFTTLGLGTFMLAKDQERDKHPVLCIFVSRVILWVKKGQGDRNNLPAMVGAPMVMGVWMIHQCNLAIWPGSNLMARQRSRGSGTFDLTSGHRQMTLQ